MSLRRLALCVLVMLIAVALLPSMALAASTSTGSSPGLPSSPHTAHRTVAAQTLCPTCGGLGQLLCPACGGAGTYPIIGYGGYMEFWPCSVCLMTGRIRCYTCLGTGLAPGVPYIVMSPTSMNFTATVGGGNPFSQALTVGRSDFGAWGARITASDTWAQVSFDAGTEKFYVSPQTAGLAPRTYTTNVLVEMWSDRIDGTPVQGSPLHVPVTFVVNPLGNVAAPTITPNGGTFNSAQSVTIACGTAGAAIRYTTDGTTPTVSSALYSVPINVSASSTLKVRAFKTNWTGSAAQAAFTINMPRTIVPSAGGGGSISPNTPQTVNSGASKTFTITPASGYHVASVIVDGKSVGAVTSYSFTNINANHTISATFAANTAAPVKLSTTTRLSGPSSVKVRRTLKLTGTVAPSAARGTVAIVKTRLVGGTWKPAGTARVSISSGSYRYSFKPTKKGRWRFVAKYSGAVVGTTTYLASKSSTRSVRVK